MQCLELLPTANLTSPLSEKIPELVDTAVSETDSEVDCGSKDGALAKRQQVQCDTCKKIYSSRKSLKIHTRTHTGYKPYHCTICPKSFSQSNVLKAHINAHTGQRDFFCNICGRAFTQSAHMKTHERIHTKRKDHTCAWCNRSFGSKGVLIRHFRQHTGEKPYRCARCPKTFTRAESLRSHENSHDGIRPHTCKYQFCKSTFTKKSSRKRHEKTCHRDVRNLVKLEPFDGHALAFDDFECPMTPLSPEMLEQCLAELNKEEISVDDFPFLADSPCSATDCSSESGFLSESASPPYESDGRASYGSGSFEVKMEPPSPSAYIPAFNDVWTVNYGQFPSMTNVYPLANQFPEPTYHNGPFYPAPEVVQPGSFYETISPPTFHNWGPEFGHHH